ncbi:MAG: DUF624 domain-containing protein [Clostridiales bacterium]|nr:DUF624 domain-containing protein [Clostridiales bacterium]
MFGKMMNSFYYGKSGKGDFRKEDLPTNRWQLFWEMLRVRIAGLMRLNLMTLVAWLPLIITIGTFVSTVFNVLVISGDYENYLQTGEMGNLVEAQIEALKGIDLHDFQMNTFYQAMSTMLVWMIPSILITGPIQAGMAYITRNWARDEHAFVWSDFKDAVKENWKQGLGVSAITCVLPIVIYIGFQFYGDMAADNAFFILPQMVMVMLGLVWALGLTFMYPMMVCYKMSFKDLVKNSILMAIAKLPMTVAIRLAMLLPALVCLVVFYFTGALLAFLVLAIYYVFLGYALSRFVFASFTNAVFDKYINSRIEGVEINRGLASEDDDDDDEELENAENTQQ